MTYGISIIVRSHNDERFIVRTLSALLAQNTDFPTEILCCDDNSTDRTPELIAAFPEVRNIPRPKGPYLPGRTLNYLVRQCRFPIVVFNNGDAVPQGNCFLDELTAPLRAETADAVYANQLPRPEADLLVRKDHARAFGDGRTARRWKFFFSLASAAVFRDDVLAHPFSERLRYSEDVEWAFRRKLRIVYIPEAQVEHSHNYSFRELRRRFYGEGYAEGEISGRIPGLLESLSQAGVEIIRDILYLLPHPSGWGELFMSPGRRLIQRMARRKGARDYLRGKRNA